MPISPNSLVDVINKNKDKKLLASKIIETNPKILPILPKLIRNPVSSKGVEEDHITFNKAILENMYNRIRSVRHNNKNIIKLFPDIELAIQILVSSILSPKKMTDVQLNYKLNKKFTLNPVISASLLDSLKEYINDNYEIEEKLADIIREALFNSGAYALTVIPESSIDQLINADIMPSYSTEEFKLKVDNILENMTKPINILSNSFKQTPLSVKPNKQNFVEHLASESYIKVTDNVSILHFDKIKSKISNSLIKSSLRKNVAIAQESIDRVNYIDIFRQRQSTIGAKDVEFIKTKTETRRKSVGKPMMMRIPTESTIPVFIPGNETDHIGYFIMLDESGKPLNSEVDNNNISPINSLMQQNTQAQLSPVQKAYNNLVSDITDNVNVNELFIMYRDVLEKQLYSSVKNSLYGSNVDISNKNDIYFLMFSRALAEQKTSLLFVPKELLVYIAFQYNDLGAGRSLLENLSVLSSLRAILLFAKVMAYSKQSIDVTKVNISLDPNDPDPEKTIEQIQDSVLKLRQNYFPLGINNPVDLINWIQRAGLQFSYENNPLIPNVKIDFENAGITHTIPNSDLEEELRKQTILALGLSPETIDSGFSPEFATTVVNNNILLSKRVSLYQATLIKHLNKLVSMLIYNDEDLRSLLREKITANISSLNDSLDEEEKQLLSKDKAGFIEHYIDKLSDNINVDLPKPDNTNITNLSADYDLYKENLDKVIESVISVDIFSENISGNITAHIDTIKNVYKHYLLRKWMSENNFYPEALDISCNSEEDVKNMLSVITDHLTSTMKNSNKLLSIMQLFKKAVDKDLESIDGDGASSSYTESSSDSGSDSGFGSDDEGGGDEGGGDIVKEGDDSLDF